VQLQKGYSHEQQRLLPYSSDKNSFRRDGASARRLLTPNDNAYFLSPQIKTRLEEMVLLQEGYSHVLQRSLLFFLD
jgi:hypothetical protein